MASVNVERVSCLIKVILKASKHVFVSKPLVSLQKETRNRLFVPHYYLKTESQGGCLVLLQLHD